MKIRSRLDMLDLTAFIMARTFYRLMVIASDSYGITELPNCDFGVTDKPDQPSPMWTLGADLTIALIMAGTYTD